MNIIFGCGIDGAWTRRKKEEEEKKKLELEEEEKRKRREKLLAFVKQKAVVPAPVVKKKNVFGEVEEEKKKIDFKLDDAPAIKQEDGIDAMQTEKSVPAPDEVEVDPLDAFMAGISTEVQELNRDSLRKAHVESQTVRRILGLIFAKIPY